MNYKEALDLVKDALHQHKEQIYDEPSVMAYSAMKKQIPKKPIKLPESEQHIRYTDTYRCPTCGGNFGGTVREEKTMLEVFVERNPEAPLHPDKGIPNDICPYLMGYEKTPYCDDKEHCCCVDCWDREYKDVK